MLACVFAVFVWPTRYRYDHITRGKVDLVGRIDLFSGRAQTLELDGTWQPR